jgi:hypothetical protein
MFSDEYVSLFPENWYSTVDPIVELIDKNGALEFSFKVDDDELIESYKLKNYDGLPNEEILGYCFPSVKYTHLRFGYISISPEFRNKGISSYIMTKIILTIISEYPQKNFLIDLKNTSSEIANPLKLYSSLLIKENKKWQYRFFSIKTRPLDIEKLTYRLYKKKKKLESHFNRNK